MIGMRTITRTSYAAGSRGTDGRFVPGTATATSISAQVQTATDEDLQRLPEGFRTREAKRIYSRSAMSAGSQHDAINPDRLTIDGVVYQVHTVDIQEAVLPHYRAICTRVQE